MAIEAKARIVVEGGPEALKTVNGLDRALRKTGNESKRSANEQQRHAADTARAYERQAKVAEREAARARTAQEREAKRAAAEVARQEARKAKEVERNAKAAQRAAEREAKATTRAAEREAAKQIRLSERTAKSQERDRQRQFRSNGGLISGAIGGVVAGGLAAGATARGIVGQADVGERIRRANDFRGTLIRTAAQAGVSDARRDQIQSQVLESAVKSGIDPADIVAGLEVAQKQFNAFEKFANIMDEIAVNAQASGSSVEDLVGAMGYVQQAFGLTEKEVVEAMNLMTAASSSGSIEVSDFARDFASVAGIFAANTGQKGLSGVKQFLGVSQAAGTLGAGSAQTATMVERFTSDLKDSGVRKRLKQSGIKFEGVSTEDLINQIATNKKTDTTLKRSKIFSNVISSQALEAMVAARNRVASGTDKDAIDIGSIAGLDASAGAALTSKTFSALEQSGMIEAQREGIKMQAEVTKNLAEYNAQVMRMLKLSNQLESMFGSLAVFGPTLAAMGAGSVAGKLLGGGEMGEATGALGKLGKAGRALGAAGAVAGVGLAAYEGASALGADKLGEAIGNAVFDWFNDSPPGRPDGGNTAVAPGTVAAPAPAVAPVTVQGADVKPLVDEMRKQTRTLEAMHQESRGRAAPITNTVARSPR